MPPDAIRWLQVARSVLVSDDLHWSPGVRSCDCGSVVSLASPVSVNDCGNGGHENAGCTNAGHENTGRGSADRESADRESVDRESADRKNARRGDVGYASRVFRYDWIYPLAQKQQKQKTQGLKEKKPRFKF